MTYINTVLCNVLLKKGNYFVWLASSKIPLTWLGTTHHFPKPIYPRFIPKKTCYIPIGGLKGITCSIVTSILLTVFF